MKTITLWLMNYQLKRAIRKRDECDNVRVVKAYNLCINNFENTIIFLGGRKKSKKTKKVDINYMLGLNIR